MSTDKLSSENETSNGILGAVSHSSIFEPLIKAWNSFGSNKEKAKRNIDILKDYSNRPYFKLSVENYNLIMDIYEFHLQSNRFIEWFKSYSLELDSINSSFYTALKWLLELQAKGMENIKARNKFAYYIETGSTIYLKTLLANYCNESNLIHFNAFALIDSCRGKFKL